MKKLYIIRHAKSSWKDIALDDFNRPLNKRGKQNAPFMGSRLRAKGVKPDIILSSPAKRAKSTAKMIAKEMSYNKKIVFDSNIYEASADDLRKIIAGVDNRYKTLFLVGHNPSLNELAKYFLDFDANIPTCGIVEIAFACKRWADIDPNNAKFLSFDYPKKVMSDFI